MTKGATVIVSLALVWGAGCGTNSAIGNLHTGGAGGNDGVGGGRRGSGWERSASAARGLAVYQGIGGSGTGRSTGNRRFGYGRCRLQGDHEGPVPAKATPVGTAKSLAFAAPVDYPTGAAPLRWRPADLNGDGKLDLVLLDSAVGARVMLNNGDGTFGSPADKTLGSPPVCAGAG